MEKKSLEKGTELFVLRAKLVTHLETINSIVNDLESDEGFIFDDSIMFIRDKDHNFHKLEACFLEDSFIKKYIMRIEKNISDVEDKILIMLLKLKEQSKY